jgi:hypothetical protein
MIYNKGTLKAEREARLEAVGFAWKSRDQRQPHNESGDEEIDVAQGSDKARGSTRRSIMRWARTLAAVEHREKEETDKRESTKVGADSTDNVKVGTRLCVLRAMATTTAVS